MIIMSSMIVMSSASSMIVVSTTTHLMEFDSIAIFFLLSIKTNLRQIVPYRQSCSSHEIREEDLVDQEDGHQWDDSILMHDRIHIYPRSFYRTEIVGTLSEVLEDIPDSEDIGPLDTIDDRTAHHEEESETHEHILDDIEEWMSRLRDHESPMDRKEYRQYKDEIDRGTHDEDRESKRK